MKMGENQNMKKTKQGKLKQGKTEIGKIKIVEIQNNGKWKEEKNKIKIREN